MKNIIGESRWREKRVLGQDAVGDATTPSGCGSNGCSLRVRRLRELHGNSRDHHALRRHWINHVSADARAAYIAGAGVAKDQLEEVVADESLALIDHYRIVRAGLYKGFGAASEIGDCNALALIAGGSRGIG